MLKSVVEIIARCRLTVSVTLHGAGIGLSYPSMELSITAERLYVQAVHLWLAS
jgi:hypothetical protein